MLNKELIWWHVKPPLTPPFGKAARKRAGFRLRLLQLGELIFRIDDDAIVVLEIFKKKTRTTPERNKNAARQRLGRYDDAIVGDKLGADS